MNPDAAALYSKNHPGLQHWDRDVLSKIDFLCGEYGRIIDVGCGTGEVTNILQQKFPDATIVAFDKVIPLSVSKPNLSQTSCGMKIY